MGVFGLILMAKASFADGFGEVRRYEGQIDDSKRVGMGEVREAEARMEAKIREDAKLNLLEIVRSLETLPRMPNNDPRLKKFSDANFSANQVTGIYVTFSNGQGYLYSFETQQRGLFNIVE